MSSLRSLKNTLVEKLQEWANSEEISMIIIDTFISLMEAEEWDNDDILAVLEYASDCFKKTNKENSFIYESLDYRCMAIKVNKGYLSIKRT